MNKIGLLLLILLLIACKPEKITRSTTLELKELQPLPEAITNNAVSEGFLGDTTFIYTFGGLDSTKLASGIHKRSYRLNLKSQRWQRIADLPDTLGKIASAASQIKNIIYIMGGYHVFADGSELSSNKVHRYDVVNKRFLADGAAIPTPIDDHVQVVYKDSLIYLISGWSDTENVSEVQIYNPANNSWTKGSSVPEDHLYKSFGASGTIIGDSIFYFGGAAMGQHYPIQNILRIGYIDQSHPQKIQWSYQVLDSSQVGYRMAATTLKNKAYWLGGSAKTYNYNAISYKGSLPVEPSESIFDYSDNHLTHSQMSNLPMDLRGLANINDSTRIIIGGIGKKQQVSNKVYQITWREQ